MSDRPEWFAPKRYGFGAGLPIAWQGWAVLLAFILLIVAIGVGLDGRPALQASILFPAIAVLLLITARTTRGGWRWRWGEKE